MSEKKPFFTKENMARESRPQHWWHKGLQLSEHRLREAMANTRSNKEAARWLGITDMTYKKYAKNTFDEATGKSLFEIHKNQAGKGMPKNWAGGIWKKNLDDMLVENQPINAKKILRLKELLMKDGRLGYQCSACKYGEKRLTDMKAPLLLNFKNGKKSDWRIENIQWLCYNCHFLFVGDPFSNRMLQRIESHEVDVPEIKEDIQTFYEIDDFYYQHLKNLGLDGSGDVLFKPNDIIDYKDPDDGSEFIDIKT
jgi:hypothetical protein